MTSRAFRQNKQTPSECDLKISINGTFEKEFIFLLSPWKAVSQTRNTLVCNMREREREAVCVCVCVCVSSTGHLLDLRTGLPFASMNPR